MNDNDELYNNDNNLLGGIRDHTSRLDLNNTSDHTVEIDQLAGTELAEIFVAPLRKLTSRNLDTGSNGLTYADSRAEHTSDGQVPAVNSPSASSEDQRRAQRVLKN